MPSAVSKPALTVPRWVRPVVTIAISLAGAGWVSRSVFDELDKRVTVTDVKASNIEKEVHEIHEDVREIRKEMHQK
jgi:hypothetical protein